MLNRRMDWKAIQQELAHPLPPTDSIRGSVHDLHREIIDDLSEMNSIIPKSYGRHEYLIRGGSELVFRICMQALTRIVRAHSPNHEIHCAALNVMHQIEGFRSRSDLDTVGISGTELNGTILQTKLLIFQVLARSKR